MQSDALEEGGGRSGEARLPNGEQLLRDDREHLMREAIRRQLGGN